MNYHRSISTTTRTKMPNSFCSNELQSKHQHDHAHQDASAVNLFIGLGISSSSRTKMPDSSCSNECEAVVNKRSVWTLRLSRYEGDTKNKCLSLKKKGRAFERPTRWASLAMSLLFHTDSGLVIDSSSMCASSCDVLVSVSHNLLEHIFSIGS